MPPFEGPVPGIRRSPEMRRTHSPTVQLGVLAVALVAVLIATGCGKPPKPTLSLYRAVQVGDLDQIERHIRWDSDLSQRNPDGSMPIHAAARAGQVGIVRILVQNGVDPNAVDGSGRTPMELALASGKPQVAKALLDLGARLDPQAVLIALVRAGVSDRDSFDFLIRQGADPDRPDPKGQAPLHLAVSLDRLETVKRLLSRGADVNRPDGTGASPLDLAERLDPGTPDRADIVRALKRYGARPEPRTDAPNP
jgi:ankyrin repeat protein